jgi:hypothetical protein
MNRRRIPTYRSRLAQIRRRNAMRARSRYAQIEDLSFESSEIDQTCLETVTLIKNLARKVRNYKDVVPSSVDGYFQAAAVALQQAYGAMSKATNALTNAAESISDEFNEETDS